MNLNELQPARGAHRDRERVGRGISGGGGKTAGRGQKGQGSRSGGVPAPYFEGGQLPLVRRLPQLRGFTNIWRIEFAPINVERLNGFEAGTEVTPELLVAAGLIKSPATPVKVLGDGELDRALKVKAHKFSAAAREKILAAGGSVEELSL
ncbi:MAG: 50S ribosomal protein L15 [Chloroflexi bacterium]|nr:50S ribosomal protein L15 [Chloroflexota bacterium]